MYFNYLLQSDNPGSPILMTDSARVFASSDGGVTWFEVATNNVTNDQGPASLTYELPQYITPSVSANPANAVQQVVQPLLSTNAWRQARIDMSSFAGQANIKLRFDFSTSGTTYNSLNGLSPLPGDINGVGPKDARAAQNNNLTGWFIDDIIVGVTNRGEMVTGAPNGAAGGTTFFQIPRDPNIGQSLTGPYQLEIRPGQPYATQTPSFTGGIYYDSGASPFASNSDLTQTAFVGMNNPGEFPQTSINTLLNFGTSIGYQPYDSTPTNWNLGTTTIQPQFAANQTLQASHTLSAPPGSVVQDGQTFTISDGVTVLTFEFNLASTATLAGYQRIQFTTADTSYVVARNIVAAINAANTAGKFKVSAEQSDGTITGTSSTDPNVNVLNAVAVSSLVLPSLTVTLNNASLAENGVSSTTGFVTRQGDLSQALTVNLSAIYLITGALDNTDLTISGGGLVSFAAGAAVSANFTVTSVNSTVEDGTRTVAIVASENGYTSASATIDLNDVSPGSLGISPDNNILHEGNALTAATEGGAVQTAFVFRNTVGVLNNVALAVTLTSLTPSRLTIVTPNVVIAAGSNFTTFTYEALQDGIAADPVTVNILATATSLVSGAAPVTTVNATPDLNIKVPVAGVVHDISKQVLNQSEGAITMDPADATNKKLFSFSNNGFAPGATAPDGMVGEFSIDGGVTWTQSLFLDGVTPDGVGGASGILPQAWSDPTVTADGFGNLFVGYIDKALTTVILLKSTDFGQTFTQIAAPLLTASSIDQPTIVASKFNATTGSLWVTYRDFAKPGLIVSGATVTGLGLVGAFTAPAVVPGTIVDGSFGDIAIGPNGAVAVAYENPTGGTGPAGLFVSVDKTGVGGAFGPSTRVTTTNVGGFYPIPAQPNRTIDAEVGLAWDTSSGRLYMVYTDSPSVGSVDTSTYVRFADWNGATLSAWSNRLDVNDFAGTDSQFLPRIAVDNQVGSATQGDVAVSFYDTRNDQGQGAGIVGGIGGDTNGVVGDDAEMYTAISLDDGGTFGRNIQISTAPSNVADANNSGNDYGDYTGLTFNNGTYFPMWADNSTAIAGVNPDGALSALDMATAAITLQVPTPLQSVTVAFTTPVVAGSLGTGTVTLSNATAVAVGVVLTSSDPNATAGLPSFVTIPAGTSANAPISFTFFGGFSNSTFGTPTAIVTPTLAGYQTNAGYVDVENLFNVPALSLTLSSNTLLGLESATGIRQTVAAGGSVVATLTRNTPNTLPMTVTLYNPDPALIGMPTSIIIPAGQSVVQFMVTGVLSNSVIDQTLGLTAASPGFASATTTLDVTNQRPANYDSTTTFFGDNNIVRQQGHIQIIDNTVSNSQNYGIVVSSVVTTPLPGASLWGIVGGNAATFTVTAVGLNYNNYLAAGDFLLGPDGAYYQIGSISANGATVFLSTPYNGSPTSTTGVATSFLSDSPGNPIGVRNLPTLDTLGLVPSTNIVNNVIDNFGTGGILFTGAPSLAGQPTGVVPYGRIVNNTIYGGAAPTGTGIIISNNAAPTLMNNIVTNTTLGISVDASSSTKVVNGVATPLTFVSTSLYQNDTTDALLNGVASVSSFPSGGVPSVTGAGTNPIQLKPLNYANPTDPNINDPYAKLFVNPGVGNFYLREGSKAIDSSVNSVSDNAQIDSVLSAIGLPPSPIIAPLTDRFGQLRVADPNFVAASGLGQNIFIDRGALERADFVGPTAQLTTPLDNGVDDGNPAVNNVFIVLPTALTEIDVQLADVGVGIDNTTVVTSDFVLKQDGVTLVDGTDYKFVYNTTTHTARFEAISVFPFSSNYTIAIPKVNGVLPIADLAGNPIQANQADGTVLFTIIGNKAPTITSVNTLTAVRDTTLDIPYGSLGTLSPLTPPSGLIGAVSPVNMNVVTGHIPDFLLTAPPVNGTLTITKANGTFISSITFGTAVAPDNSNLVQPGDVLHWTPPASATYPVTELGFSVIGYDPTNAVLAPALSQSSAPGAPVNFKVIDPSPLLTTDTTLGVAALNPVAFPISYTSLVSGLGASWIEATVPAQQELQITPNTANGTLSKNGVVQTTTFLMGPSDSLTWVVASPLPDVTPVNSTDHVTAFTVKAYDLYNATNFPAFTTSAALHTVFINVLNVSPPTINSAPVTLGPKARYVPTTLSYSDLLGATNANLGAGNSGDTLAFRIESLQSLQPNTLQINHGGVLTSYNAAQVAAGTVFIMPGDTVTFAWPAGATGTQPAFTVSAYDFEKALDGFVNVGVSVNLVNFPPVLTSVIPFGPADQQTPFTITFAMLAAHATVTDQNFDPIQFHISSFVASNTQSFTINHNNVISNVSAGQLVGPGDTLTWTPASSVSNTVPAFSITAFDGTADSSASLPVNITVRPLGTAFDLTGAWAVVSGTTTSSVLGRITQTGANFTLVNSDGKGANGQYTGLASVALLSTFDGHTGVTGTIDLNTPDQGRILWSDGTVWLRISLGGTYSVTGGGISSPTLGTISQTGTQLTFAGPMSGSTTIQTPTLLGTGSLAASYADGAISFFSNGQVWTKLDLPTNYTNQSGSATQIIQNGASLTFVDKFGGTSPGYWTSPTQVFATAWNESATTAPGKLLWQDGSFWSENLVFNGSNNGAGKTTISAAPSQVSVFDYLNSNGMPVHLVQTGTTNIIIIDANGHMSIGTFVGPSQFTTPYFPGDVATISPDMSTVTWTDGTHWTQAASNAITLTNYTNQNGVPVHLIQNGTNQIGFVDGLGRTSLGTMLSASTAQADLYPGDVATISGNTVTWQDGFVWTQTNALPLVVTFTDTNGSVSHVRLTSTTALIGLDGQFQGLTATRLNGKLYWSNGVVWNNFDFNALNALFEMAIGYP